MNKLDELIQELCPDGVEYKSFGDCAKIVRGASPRPIKNFITTEPDGVNWIKIGDVKPGEKYITSSAEKITLDGAKKSRSVKKGDFILSNSMSFGRPYILKIDGCVHDGWLAISEFSDSYVSDFLYYLLSSNMCQNQMKKKASFGGAVQNLNADIVRELSLPVPPLEVQQEIVYLLDDFTAKTAELQTELNKEYEARKKQYECYRDNLIRNELHISKVINLIDIADVYDSLHQTPSYSINGYNMVRVQDIKGGYINIDKTLKVEETVWKLFTQKYVPQPNDVVVSRVGSYGNFALIPNNQCCLGQNVALIHPKINPQYLYYVLTSTMTKQWINNNVKGTSQKSLSLADIKRVPIPVPNENNQKYIADILNNFNITMDELQLNISIELESRQKQYEYYRDKLLTFKESNESEVN